MSTYEFGQRVEVIDNSLETYGVPRGTRGTVLEKEPLLVQWDVGHIFGQWWVEECNIKPVEKKYTHWLPWGNLREGRVEVVVDGTPYSEKLVYVQSHKTNHPKGIQHMLTKLSATLKRVLSASMQSQYKAGFRNGDLALTPDGKNELLEILAAEHEAKLTARAEEIIAEAEQEK